MVALVAVMLMKVPTLCLPFVPPVSVESVAKASVTFLLDPDRRGPTMDVWEIRKYG